jgi:hypothetical protein
MCGGAVFVPSRGRGVAGSRGGVACAAWRRSGAAWRVGPAWGRGVGAWRLGVGACGVWAWRLGVGAWCWGVAAWRGGMAWRGGVVGGEVGMGDSSGRWRAGRNVPLSEGAGWRWSPDYGCRTVRLLGTQPGPHQGPQAAAGPTSGDAGSATAREGRRPPATKPTMADGSRPGAGRTRRGPPSAGPVHAVWPARVRFTRSGPRGSGSRGSGSRGQARAGQDSSISRTILPRVWPSALRRCASAACARGNVFATGTFRRPSSTRVANAARSFGSGRTNT